MLKVKLLRPGAKLPVVAHEKEDLGYDLFALEDVRVHPTHVFAEPVKVRTGIAVEDSDGLGFIIKDRSSMASKGVFTHGGVIDAGYRGEIAVLLSSASPYDIKAGDKIAQMIPVRPLTAQVVEAAELAESSRGGKGFGSSGS